MNIDQEPDVPELNYELESPHRSGSLSPAAERALYERNRPAWFRYVAPGLAEQLILGGADAIRQRWPLMSEDYKRALWPLFAEDMRTLVRRVVEQLALDGKTVGNGCDPEIDGDSPTKT